MMKLTDQSGKRVAVARSTVCAVFETANSTGTVLLLDPAANKSLSVKEPYAKVMRALEMKGRRN